MANEVTGNHESGYNEILRHCVAVINNSRKILAQQVASIASSTYWEIGKLLDDCKLDSKHGSGVVRRLSIDLKEQFPEMGLSPRNLWDMKRFYERYKDSDEKLRRSVALLPWKHNYYLSLLDRLERQPDENRSIGIILCAEKDRLEVELALEDMGKPIGVADYQLIIPEADLQRVITDEMKNFEIVNHDKGDEG